MTSPTQKQNNTNGINMDAILKSAAADDRLDRAFEDQLLAISQTQQSLVTDPHWTSSLTGFLFGRFAAIRVAAIYTLMLTAGLGLGLSNTAVDDTADASSVDLSSQLFGAAPAGDPAGDEWLFEEDQQG